MEERVKNPHNPINVLYEWPLYTFLVLISRYFKIWAKKEVLIIFSFCKIGHTFLDVCIIIQKMTSSDHPMHARWGEPIVPSATIHKSLIFLTKTNQNIIGSANLPYFGVERLNIPQICNLMNIEIS